MIAKRLLGEELDFKIGLGDVEETYVNLSKADILEKLNYLKEMAEKFEE